MASFGPIEALQVVYSLEKIEFDDLLKLEGVVNKKPYLASRIINAMVHNRAEYFYKEIVDILVEEKVLPQK